MPHCPGESELDRRPRAARASGTSPLAAPQGHSDVRRSRQRTGARLPAVQASRAPPFDKSRVTAGSQPNCVAAGGSKPNEFLNNRVRRARAIFGADNCHQRRIDFCVFIAAVHRPCFDGKHGDDRFRDSLCSSRMNRRKPLVGSSACGLCTKQFAYLPCLRWRRWLCGSTGAN